MLCGACTGVCKNGCHVITAAENEGQPSHFFSREDCILCGACAESCHTGAIEKLGKEEGVDAILDEVMRDAVFYKNSGGGSQSAGRHVHRKTPLPLLSMERRGWSMGTGSSDVQSDL